MRLKKKPGRALDKRTKALNYARLLLKFRQRSEREIYQRLIAKEFPTPVIEEVIFFLKAKGLIEQTKQNYSEEETVLSLAKERFKQLGNLQRGKAKGRIYRYLLRRGFPVEIVAQTLENL
jgi:SOS response regulatory protein OraA/RecX